MRSFKSTLVRAKERFKHSFNRENKFPSLAVDGIQKPHVETVVKPEVTESQASEHQPRPPSRREDAHKSLSHAPVVDEEIPVNIMLNYNDELLDDIRGFHVRWMDPLLLDVLDEKASSRLEACSLVPEATRLHREAGECSLIRQSDQRIVSTTVWKSEEQWRESLVVMIMKFCAAEVQVPFFLNIKWDYVDPRIMEVPDEPYVNTVAKAITRKMTKNWKKIDYISESSLKTILSKNTISLLVDRDTSLPRLFQPAIATTKSENDFDRDLFIDLIWTDGVRLLALHVFTITPLACLLRLMKRGMLDAHLLKKPLTEKDCPCEDYLHTFKALVMLQDRFVLHTFPKLGRLPTHHDLNPEIGMPIKSLGRIGSGSFGEVFKVSIETGHHEFPCDDLGGCFAMKVFFNSGQRTQEDFNRESKMLQTLAEFPHEHITPYLASWTQNGTFYMLFPLATSNLRTLLDRKLTKDLDEPFMIWLISQLAGLADGVRKIHNIGGRSGSTVLSRIHKPVSGKARIGFHHDLRPENILVFEKTDASYQTLRISDFGSANFRHLPSGVLTDSKRSIKTRGLFDGDPSYGAPESGAVEGTSRPYDIWSLGCIFLEITLWVFGEDLNGFTFERLTNSRDHTIKSQGSAFWYKTSKGEPKLKPAVTLRLTQLIQRCAGRGSFEDLVSIIRRMLSLSPADRITAAEVSNALDAMKDSVAIELREDPRAYMVKGNHTTFAAPPSNVIEGLTSIDDTPTPAQLTPKGIEHRRANSDGKQVRRLLERSSFSDPLHLHPIETDLPMSETSGRSRSPSINISHVDDPGSVIDGMDVLEVLDFAPPVGAHSVPWGLEDLVSRRPPSARSRRSFSEGDAPINFATVGS